MRAIRNKLAPLKRLPAAIGFPWPSSRRLLVIDPGSHSVKVMLVEMASGRLTVLRHWIIDLAEEGLLNPAEINRHLQTILEEIGPHPIALALPDRLAMSEVIDLPPADAKEVRELIEQETVKLSGLSESAMVYDYLKLQPFGKHDHPYWVTLCQEARLLAQINGLTLAKEHFCAVTTGAHAMLAAYQALQPGSDQVVLVDLGANTTVLVIMIQGQGVHAGHFPIGGNAFGEAIAAHKKCSLETAEAAKGSQNLLTGAEALPGLLLVVDGWIQELERSLMEWQREQAVGGVALMDFQIVLSGGGASQPGLIDYLNHRGRWRFKPWPDNQGPAARLAVAFGTALQTFGRCAQPVSLLPSDLKTRRRSQRAWQWVHAVNYCLVLLMGLMLAAGTWTKFKRVSQKNSLLNELQTAFQKARDTESLANQVLLKYENLRPVLERQRQTADTLTALSLLQQARSNRNFWCVLFADQHSYFSSPPLAQTNGPDFAISTNAPAYKRGFIAELCLAEGGEAMRQALSQLVTDLKRDPIFSSVDSLSADRRRQLVDSKLVVPERNVALVMDLAETGLQPAYPATDKTAPASDSRAEKAAPPPFVPKPEGSESPFPVKDP